MKRTILLLMIFLGLLLAVSLFYFGARRVITKPGKNSNPVLIEITKGETISQAVSDLSGKGVIENERAFFWFARLRRVVLKAGFYEIPSNASILQAVALLDSGKIKLVKLTFPEGWRAEQMAQRLSENGVVDYQSFMAEAKSREGKLFPDTYFFNPKESASKIVRMMTDNYNERTAGLAVFASDLVLASIVEREAADDNDRPIIASIYLNRLARGMKLEADPTVQYGRDTNEVRNLLKPEQENFKYWRSITMADYLSVASEYNTYLISGLPAAAICNPGLSSIRAVLDPAQSDYLYFLHRGGKIYPSKTEAEHNQKRATVLGATTE